MDLKTKVYFIILTLIILLCCYDQPTTENFEQCGPLCFPGNAVISLDNGNNVMMKDLQIGNRVYVCNSAGNVVTDEVVDFLHKNPTEKAEFLTLILSNGKTLTASGEHLIYSGDDYKVMKDMIVGDIVHYVENGQLERVSVRNITTEQLRGIYAPLTKSGSIIVDNVRFSCFSHYGKLTKTNYHTRAFCITAPMRHGLVAKNKLEGRGIHTYARSLMSYADMMA